jgi:HK97 family phage major capsid protein
MGAAMKPEVKSMVRKLATRKPAAPAAETQETEVETKGASRRQARRASDVFGRGQGGSDGPYIKDGALSGSRGYSCQKALEAGRSGTWANATLEEHVDGLLRALYVDTKQWIDPYQGGALIPLGLELMPDEIQNEPEFVEIKQLVLAGAKDADPDEVRWLKKAFYGTKAQSWIDTFAGGALVGAPVQGELIDLLRNKLAFGKAEIAAMPPTGVRFPKWQQDPIGSWANENEESTPQNAKVGNLTFLPKKLLCTLVFPNELRMYGSPSVDAMFRNSLMASVGLSMDAGFLRGNGSDDQPWGLVTMANQQNDGVKDWGLNLINIGANQILNDAPQDLMDFPSAIESNNGELTQWIGRPDYFWNILKQRFSTIAANDGQGGFLYDFARAAAQGFPDQLLGRRYNKTNQVQKYANPEPTASGLQFITDLIGLCIEDFWIGMLGAVEVVESTQAGDTFFKDQTALRAKIIGNGGPKHNGQVAIALNLQY